MKTALAILTIAGLAVLASCSSTPKPVYDYDPLTDFSKYRFFDWLPTQDAEDPYLTERIKRAVVLNLTERGYLQSGSPPTLLTSVQVGGTEAPGVIKLTMVDGDTSRRVWSGSISFAPPTGKSPDEVDKICREAVDELLKAFPPPKDDQS